MTRAETHTFTGAYALHALAGAERTHFDHHLGDCAGCAQEVRELIETAARLGANSTTATCPKLRRRVLAEIATTRQAPRTPCCTVTAYQACRRRPHRVAIGATALVTITTVLAAIATGLHLGDDAPGATPAAPGEVLAAPDAVTDTTTNPHGATLTAILAPSRGKILIMAADLPHLDDAHTYQVWLALPDGPRSAGLLLPTPSGTLRPVMTDFRPDTRAVALTLEPLSGSPAPTGPAIARVDLT